VGRIVMTKAAKHLTPMALELGSKCPCIVDWLDGKRDSQVHMPLFFFKILQFCNGSCVPRQDDLIGIACTVLATGHR
jgi:aldehyde dehydrogenase (NAD+)